MSNKRGEQHVLDGVATRGALGFQGLFGCVGIKVCGVMTLNKLLESREALVEPAIVHIVRVGRWEEIAKIEMF